MSREILKLIAENTFGESYQAHKLELDLEKDSSSRIDNREVSEITHLEYAETKHNKNYVPLKDLADKISSNGGQILTYFLDGSRHVYKIDEKAYRHSNARKMVYPVVAGQITVGCCRRVDKQMQAENFNGEIILTLPSIADPDDSKGFFPALVSKINNKLEERQLNLKVSKILPYGISRKNEEKFEEIAIAKIQDRMYEAEQEMVAELVNKNKLGQKNYLVKDGSLEYRITSDIKSDKRRFSRFKNNYDFVIGLSKKFNLAMWLDSKGKPNPGFIADLPVYNRTPAIRFKNYELFGNIEFAVWYLRLREKYTDSAFDGVIKVEKMLVNDEEQEDGMDSELVDLLSTYIINERNPVCYGSDNRWANHIYPMFLTESFINLNVYR